MSLLDFFLLIFYVTNFSFFLLLACYFFPLLFFKWRSCLLDCVCVCVEIAASPSHFCVIIIFFFNSWLFTFFCSSSSLFSKILLFCSLFCQKNLLFSIENKRKKTNREGLVFFLFRN